MSILTANGRKLGCRKCGSVRLVKDGFNQYGKQRYRCRRCNSVTVCPRGFSNGR